MSGPEFNPQDDEPIDREEWEKAMRTESAPPTIETRDQRKGYSLWLSCEDWGAVCDGILLEIERTNERIKGNPESTGNDRLNSCATVLREIGKHCQSPTIETREQADALDELRGWWPKDYLGRAFVEGAQWWEWHKEKATMWPSDRDLAEAEAGKRYPITFDPNKCGVHGVTMESCRLDKREGCRAAPVETRSQVEKRVAEELGGNNE